MKSRTPIYIFQAPLNAIFILLICSWTVFTTNKTITIPGEGVYTGQVKNGQFYGEGKWQSEMGITYTGEFKEGK